MKSLSRKCSGLRASLCFAQGEGSLPLQTVPVGWGGREVRKISGVLWYSPSTWRPLQHSPSNKDLYNFSAVSEQAEQMIANPLLA